jgi:Helicase conserved C-terminal domain
VSLDVYELIPDPRSALDWYSVTALETMLSSRNDRARDVRSKPDNVAMLRAILYDPASIRRALEACDPIAREALALLRRRGGTMSAAGMRGQIATWHPELSPEAAHGVPFELIRRALAFWHTPAPRRSGSSIHDIRHPATDNEHSALIYSAPEILEHVPVSERLGETEVLPVAPAEVAVSVVGWQQRVLGFLRAIESRAPRVLQSGLIGARDRDALAAALGFASEESMEPGARAGPARSIGTHPVNFFRTAFGTAGLLEVSGERVLRTTAAAVRFVAQPPVRQARTLLDAWLESGDNELLALSHLRCERRANVPSAVPDEAQVRQAHRFIVELLREHVRPGFWYDSADLSRAARWRNVEFLVSWRDPAPFRWSAYAFDRGRFAPPTYVGISLEDSRGRSSALTLGEDWDLVEGAFIRAVLHGPLTWLGLVECQPLSRGRECFALTSLGARVLDLECAVDVAPAEVAPPADALVVQPNFDVVVYDPDERLELLYQIDRFAERVAVDRLATYRLTRDSLCNGLQLGLRIDDVLGLLERAARTPLPQNVVFTLRDWARQFEEVHWVRNGWLLEAPSEAALDRWLVEPALREAVERRLSPTVALFTGHRPPDLADRLARLGVDARPVDANEPLVPIANVEDETTLRFQTADANFYLRGVLGDLADPLPDDGKGARFRITRESMGRAREDGLTVDGILDILGRVVRRSLPAGLKVRVKGWGGGYATVEVGEVAIFAAPDAETFRDLRADPGLAEGIIESISSTAAIVRLDYLDRLKDALAERGIRTTPYQPSDRLGPPSHPTSRWE